MSTIVSTAGINGSNPSVVGGTGTGVKVFPAIGGPSFNNGGNSLTNASVATTPAQVFARAPQSEGQIFTIKAAGNLYVHGTSPTIVFSLYKGKSLTATSDTLVATCSAQSLSTGASYPFYFSITGQGDANSGLIQFGSATLYLDGVSTTFTIQSSGIPLTSQDLLTTDVPFCVAAQFGVSDALNVANLQQFVLEQ
jgi:hypothetical protein